MKKKNLHRVFKILSNNIAFYTVRLLRSVNYFAGGQRTDGGLSLFIPAGSRLVQAVWRNIRLTEHAMGSVSAGHLSALSPN